MVKVVKFTPMYNIGKVKMVYKFMFGCPYMDSESIALHTYCGRSIWDGIMIAVSSVDRATT